LAIATAVELHESHGYSRITATAIAEGIAGTYWPGRLERVHVAKGADLLFDVAHNPAGAWALRSALSGLDLPDTAPGNPATTLIFGCLEDKAVEEMAAILFPMFDRVLVTRVHSPRAASTDRLAAAARRSGTTYEIYEAPLSALEAAQTMTRDDGLIVVAGSVFLVGELRSRLHD
jgi:dihydrofolate synthase/folylpolyglutamate synthase